MEDFYIPNNLYGFALSGFTSRLLWRLKPLDMCYSVWANNIDQYLNMLIHDQPKYIVGLGTYSGVDQDCIRIETVINNQFRTLVIEKEFPVTKKLLIKPFVKQVSQTQFASTLRNSWCNLVSWKIARLIEKGDLQAKYNFLHIPKSFRSNHAIKIVESMLPCQ